jgi:protein-tyrosine phosphatase
MVRRLNLKNAFNVRDLGGFWISNKLATRWKIFLRSDNTDRIDEEDVNLLLDYGVKTVIDFRSLKEWNMDTDVMKSTAGVSYHFVPFDSDDYAFHFAKDPTKLTIGLQEGYYKLLEERQTVATIFSIIADNIGNGTILFHCSGGKDRTGLVTMMLLTIAGVPKVDILQDFHASYAYIMENPRIQEFAKKYGTVYCECAPELMRNAMMYIEENYQTVENYLMACGVKHDDIVKIKNIFTEENNR